MIKTKKNEITLRELNDSLLNAEPTYHQRQSSIPQMDNFSFTDVEHTFCQLLAKQRIKVIEYNDFVPLANVVLYIEALYINNKIDKAARDNLVDVGNKINDHTLYIEEYKRLESKAFYIVSRDECQEYIEKLFDDRVIHIIPYYCAKNRELLLAKKIQEADKANDIVLTANLIKLLNSMQEINQKVKDKEKEKLRLKAEQKNKITKIEYQNMSEEEIKELDKKRKDIA